MRTKKLIRPRVQLKLTFWFLCVIVTALILQFFLVTSALSDMVVALPGDPAETYELLYGVLVKTLAISLTVVVPLCVIVGTLATFKVAGPIYRFTQFLEAVRRGERPADCRLRKGDELQDLCELLNEATAPLRAQPESEAEEAGLRGAA